MKRELCSMVANYPTATLLGLVVLGVLCIFSVVGTVIFLGICCLLVLSIQKGLEEGWLHYEEPRSTPRRPRQRRRGQGGPPPRQPAGPGSRRNKPAVSNRR